MRGETLLIEGLTKRYGEQTALEDLCLAVPPGEVVGLLGPNGSGKTTAMRIVFGVVDADGGAVTYGGSPLNDEARRRFGYMPEERGLYPGMEIRAQVVHFARLFGLDRTAAGRRADALLDRVGLAERIGDRLEMLSLGNQQRVQLAVALAHDPDALVLDEPFSGLDPLAVDDLSVIVREAAAEGCTVLFSSHQLDLVEGLCDSVRIIDAGRMVLEGAVDELKRASGRRELRVEVDDPGRLSFIEGVTEVRTLSDGTRLALAPGSDPLEVLDRVRALGPVGGFAVETPSLSELFLAAVGRPED